MITEGREKYMQRVLVVEDSAVVQSIVQLTLRRYGCVVTCARDGVEALTSLERDGEPDLILVDINMPRMNGLELISVLRGGGALARLPVIVVSTEDHEADVKRGLDAGARAYLRKPFRPDELCAVIDRVMAAV